MSVPRAESPLQPVHGPPLQRIRWAEPVVAAATAADASDESFPVLALMFARLWTPSRPSNVHNSES